MEIEIRKKAHPAVVWYGGTECRLVIDADCPHAEEVRKIAAELFKKDYTDEQAERLIAQARELLNEDDTGELCKGWRRIAEKRIKASYRRLAMQWYDSVTRENRDIEAWGIESGILVDEVASIISPLYSFVREISTHGNALIALFLYGYQCGQKARDAAETEEPVED